MKKFTILLLAFLFFVSAPSFAALDDAGAKDLKALVEKELLWRQALMHGPNGKATPAAQVTSVVPKGEFYEVKIAGLLLPLTADKIIGPLDVTLHASPGKKDDWMFSAALPSAFSLNDGKQNTIGRVTLGKQQLIAIWLPEEGAYPKIDAQYADVRVRSLMNESVVLAAKNVKVISALESVGNTWGGTTGVVVDGLMFDPPTSLPSRLNIEKIVFGNTYEGLDLQGQRSARKDIQTPPSLSRMADSASVSLSVGSATYGEIGKPIAYSLAKLAAQAELKDLRRDKSTGDIKAGFDGFEQLGASTAMTSLLPNRGNIDVKADQLPASVMLKDLIQAALAGEQSDEQKRSLSQAQSKLLQQAGTTLGLKNTYLKSDTLDIALTGDGRASPVAAQGFAGKILLSVRGLENAIAKLKSDTSDPRSMGFAGALTGIMLTGKPGAADASGKAATTYELEMSEKDGTITMNGVDVSRLIPALASPAPVPAENPATP